MKFARDLPPTKIFARQRASRVPLLYVQLAKPKTQQRGGAGNTHFARSAKKKFEWKFLQSRTDHQPLPGELCLLFKTNGPPAPPLQPKAGLFSFSFPSFFPILVQGQYAFNEDSSESVFLLVENYTLTTSIGPLAR